MQSNRAKIIDIFVNDLKQIRKDLKIPKLPVTSKETFNTTVNLVSKSLSQPTDDQLPALFVLCSSELSRHLLADVTVETMNLYVASHIHSFDDTYTAQDWVSDLLDDVRAVYSANPQFDGYARRSRIMRTDHDTELAEPDASFLVTIEVDYIESLEYTDDPVQIPVRSTSCDLPQATRIMNGFHNALATVQGVATVTNADVWPVPNEQILRRDCPAFIYQATEEQYEYHGSQETTKRISVTLLLVAVEFDFDSYPDAIDSWVAKVKNILGSNADLGFKVNAIDLRSIRTTRSEYPVIYVETDLTIRYMQSFLKA